MNCIHCDKILLQDYPFDECTHCAYLAEADSQKHNDHVTGYTERFPNAEYEAWLDHQQSKNY